ncbi:MAG: NUDIX hydrolase [Phycisphaerae bacterium]|nr:NUDIX hydrolase [Phycisphaerae bacterium]
MTHFGERTLIHRGRKFDFEMVRYRSASGATIEREVVRHPGAVCILPILEGEGGVRIVMIRNRRFALGIELLELPAGTLEKGEEPSICAGRELIEETGYRAGSIIPLGSFYTTPGMTDERMHAFAATGLVHVGQDLEEDEQIRVEVIELARVLGMIDSGELMDAKSIVTLMMGQRRGLIGTRGRGG